MASMSGENQLEFEPQHVIPQHAIQEGGAMDWKNYSAQQFDTSDGKTSYVLFSYKVQLSNTERTQIRITIRHPNPVQILLLDLVTMSFINLPLVVWDNGQTAKANVVVTSHPQLLIVQ